MRSSASRRLLSASSNNLPTSCSAFIALFSICIFSSSGSPPQLINATANHHTFITADADFSQLSLQLERARTEHQEKSRHLQEQLDAFRHEIDEFKVDENQMTTMDRLHRDQQDQGNTKYSTIQKIKRGTTQSRVEIFEEL